MAKIVTLHDNVTDEALYPKTVVDSVYDENGNTLEGLNTRLVKLPMQVEPYSIQVNTWHTSSDGYHHITIPVHAGSIVSWSPSTPLYYALLTSYSTPVVGEEPEFVEGYEGRQSSSTSFEIPEGTNYLIVNNINIIGNISSNCNNIPIYQKCINGELTCLVK